MWLLTGALSSSLRLSLFSKGGFRRHSSNSRPPGLAGPNGLSAALDYANCDISHFTYHCLHTSRNIIDPSGPDLLVAQEKA